MSGGGIDITSGKGEPVEEAVEHDDAPANEKLTSIWAQMKVLHKLLKQQWEELKQKGSTSVDIIGHLKNFMELIKSLDDTMHKMQGEQLTTVQMEQLQPTTSKCTIYHCDPWKTIYEVIHGNVRYQCLQCEHTKMSQGAIFTHLCDVHDMVPFVCSTCGFSSANHTSLRNHKLRHKKKEK